MTTARPHPIPSRRRLFGHALAALFVSAALLACGGGGDDTPRAYYASWTGAMSDATTALPGAPAPTPVTFTDQSVRHIVRVSLPAEGSVRVKLSNLFGRQPLTFSAVHVAKSTGRGSIDPTSDTAVTFSGSGSVTLAIGEERYSDVTTLALPAQSNLAITLYFAGTQVLQTVHGLGMQLAYFGSGNQTAAADIPAAITTSARNPYFGITGVESALADKPNVVVAFGDSITDGFNSTVDAAKRYPNLLDDRLKAAGARTSVVNAGISGNRWMFDGTGPYGSGRFDRDVVEIAGVTHVIILLGINDIGFSTVFSTSGQVVSADQIIASIAGAISRAKANGIKVLLGTLLPFKGASYYSADGEAKRQAVNAWIRANPDVAGIIDFDRALQGAADPLALEPSLDSGDHLHPNDAGYAAMANAVDLTKLQ
jgi:lysophospholipase L1-like esterase